MRGFGFAVVKEWFSHLGAKQLVSQQAGSNLGMGTQNICTHTCSTAGACEQATGAAECCPPFLCQGPVFCRGMDGVLAEGTFTEDNWQQTATVIPKYQTTQAVVAFLACAFAYLAVEAMNDGVWKAEYLGLADLRSYPEAGTRFGPIKLPSFSVWGRFLQWRRARTTPAQ